MTMTVIDLEDLLAQLRIKTAPHSHHHSRSGWINIDCPDCGTWEKWHLGIRKSNLRASCWKHGPARLDRALADLSGHSSDSIRSMLSQISSPSSVADAKVSRGSVEVPSGLIPVDGEFLDYLKRIKHRKPSDIVKDWDLQALGLGAWPRALQGRVWVPIVIDQRLVSWTSRSILSNTPARYWSARPDQEVISHKQILYGFDYCNDKCIVHEGPADVWSTGYGAVCTFGKDWTENQAAMLSKMRKVTICFDAGCGALAKAKALQRWLSPFQVECSVVTLQTGDDAASADFREIQSLRKFALQ